MMRLTEDDVASGAAGDSAALHRIYEQLAPAVGGYLRSHGCEDWEDLTQDVFVALLPRLSRLRGGPSGLKTLAFSIAHARLVDVLRKRRRRPTSAPLEVVKEQHPEPSAEQDVIARLDSAEVVALLGALDERKRAVVTLRVLGELSLSETAAVLDTSVGAVKQLQRRALLELREHVLERRAVTFWQLPR